MQDKFPHDFLVIIGVLFEPLETISLWVSNIAANNYNNLFNK